MIMSKQRFHKIFRSALIVFMVSVLMLGSAISVCAAAEYPKPDKNVADDAGVLSESTIRSIQKTNETLSKEVGATIAICTVATTGEKDIATYARNIFKEWKLGEGVLLLISEEDENYYFVQSVGVDKILTNTVLEEVRDNYLEEDFAAGNIDRGVSKCVTRLSTLLSAGLEAPKTDDNDNDPDSSGTPSTDGEKTDDGKKGTTIGGVIVGFFKFLLYAVLALVVIFAALFIWALFNDDVAAFMQKYIFRRGRSQYNIPEDYYDDRLYGNSQRSQRNQQSQQRNRAPQQRPQNQQRANTYYDAYGNPVQPRRQAPQNQQNRQNPQQNYRNSQNGYPQQQYRQNQYTGDETRSFTIPGRENRR